ncbi:hypothetical protein AB8Z38_03095 [Bradyrhizobium sp. LLZ17]|uniref:Uncharacterized protein n=1 Tax=Bradyrhizobium sp. LLZ17 TaxID=3239388 RepID=A0AB39XN54_9BRAD
MAMADRSMISTKKTGVVRGVGEDRTTVCITDLPILFRGSPKKPVAEAPLKILAAAFKKSGPALQSTALASRNG